METQQQIQTLQKGFNNPLISDYSKQLITKQIITLKTPKIISLSDLETRLKLVTRMAKKDPTLKTRLKIVKRMIAKYKEKSGERKQPTTATTPKNFKVGDKLGLLNNKNGRYMYSTILDIKDNKIYLIQKHPTKKQWDNNWETSVDEVNKYLKEYSKDFPSKLLYVIKTSNQQPTTNTTPENFKVGDVFYSSWGYEQTNVDFYQVIKKIGKKTAILQELKQKTVADGGMSGKTTPIKNEFLNDKQFKRRFNEKHNLFKINSSEYARIFDGKPKYYSSYAKKGIEVNWIQEAQKEMEKKGTLGTFTKQAKRAKLTTVQFAKKVLKTPKNYIKRTVKRATMMKNMNKDKFK